MSIGLPVKLLHEAQNHVITIEVKTGELYRGYLTEAEVTPLLSPLINCLGFDEREDGQCDRDHEGRQGHCVRTGNN